jgi:endonuclease/exonuclease/phosphatase (EEP) superfamily protein YafD
MTETNAPANSSAASKRRDGRVWRILQVVALLSCLPTLGSIGARFWWVFDLMTHFRAYYAVALFVFTLILAWQRKKWSAVVCGLALALNVAFIAPLYLAPEAGETTGRVLRALVANVNSGNKNYERFLSLVREVDPDVIVVIEVNDAWMQALAPLKQDYPNGDAQPQNGNFGIAFFSRLPVDHVEILEFGGSGVPSVVATVRTNAGPVSVIGTHTIPPVSAQFSQVRNDHLRGLALYVQPLAGAWVVMGDLNTTSWSPYFRDFVRISKLRDSRCGFGIQPTWRGSAPFPVIPIDHVLISPHFAVLDRRVADDIGSDHRPVIVDLAVVKSL